MISAWHLKRCGATISNRPAARLTPLSEGCVQQGCGTSWRMNPAILAAALAAALAPVGASAADAPSAPTALSLEHKTLIRCSATFAIIAYEQGKGVQSALAFPDLRVRGKEY